MDKIKKLIFILFFALIIIVSVILFIISTNKNDDNISNNVVNKVEENTVENENTNNLNEISNNISNSDINYLKKETDTYTYFLIKNCIKSYYKSNELDNPLDIIDNNAIETLNINQENYRSFNNFESPIFRIDEIYKQKIDESKNIYLVYHKVEKNSSSKNTVVLVKIDKKNKRFSIYPYEYLEKNKYLNLKEKDELQLDRLKDDIKENKNNIILEDEISIDKSSCMKELFERYKFDLFADLEHLYETIDEEYKTTHFKTFDDLKKYIDNNKVDLSMETLLNYRAENYGNSTQYTGITREDRHYIFLAKNLMDYSLYFDDYTVVLPEYLHTYNGNMANVQAKYCIDRIIKAINDKNYEFVYEKLNPVQKNNYYPNLNDLKKFIMENFYEKNEVEFGDYLVISSNTYQYDVNIKNANNNDFTYVKLIMTVTLGEDGDFKISIVNKV